MPNANEIGKGQAIKFNGDICMVLETQHRTPGNLRAFVQATLRSMRTGKSFVQRFNSNESLEIVPMSRKKYEFSYKDNSGYHFIDPVTYEDITFQEDFVAKVKELPHRESRLRQSSSPTRRPPTSSRPPPSR